MSILPLGLALAASMGCDPCVRISSPPPPPASTYCACETASGGMSSSITQGVGSSLPIWTSGQSMPSMPGISYGTPSWAPYGGMGMSMNPYASTSMTGTAQATAPIIPLADAQVSDDGRFTATVRSDGKVTVKDELTKREVPLPATTGIDAQIDISPDGNLIAVSAADGSVKVIDVRTQTVARTVPGNGQEIATVKFTPLGLAITTRANEFKLIDLTSGIAKMEFKDPPGSNREQLVVGDLRYRGSNDGRIYVFKLTDMTGKPSRILTGHRGAITALAVTADGKQLASAATDDTLRLWDSMSGKEVASYDLGDTVSSLAYTPDGKLLAEAAGSTIKIRDVKTGAIKHRLLGHRLPVQSLRFVEGELRSVSEDGEAKAWNAAAGSENKLFANLAQPEKPLSNDGVDSIRIQVTAPPGAKLTLDGVEVTLPEDNVIQTPPVRRGRVYAYTLKAETEDGTLTRHLYVVPGELTKVNFTTPDVKVSLSVWPTMDLVVR